MGKHGVYLYEVNEIVNETLRIVEQIRIKHGSGTCKGYLVKSLAFPSDKNDYKMREGDLKKGVGCAYKAGQRTCEENSLWSIESIRGNIIDVEQAKTIPPHHTKRVVFKCSTEGCNNKKEMRVTNLTSDGYSCPKCSTFNSYGERLMLSINEYFDLGLAYQKRLPGLNLIFDFVDYSNKKIYEIQGIQHYKVNDFYGGMEQFIKQKASDLIKRKYCESIGWTYVDIDARYSDFKFIRDNINTCEHLPNILSKDEQAITELIEQNSKYPVKEIIKLYKVDKLSIKKIAIIYDVSNNKIWKVLKNNGVDLREPGGRNLRKAIRCVETEKVYESTVEAYHQTGIPSSNISNAANPNNKAKSAGKHPITGEKLHWEYVTEEN